MKENQLLTARQGQERPVRSLFADLAVGKSRSLRKRRRIGQQWVWLSGMKLDSGELLILAGNHRFPQPLEVYGLRWKIEIDQPYCLHKCVFRKLLDRFRNWFYPGTINRSQFA
ncbi:hypothetical protein [Methylomicrobium sp. Wu6]|uniref:hypothetical protein n=1 Tax=Methylomicrobium sp. Wu6 TaxID=3107928 RepID=UPI002DD62F31|nr:hypothetical protein [Methylomicrobium sp. Wu6]MEC4747518.1 hypothetical protein [Methylomicrobium sp. Wu6]